MDETRMRTEDDTEDGADDDSMEMYTGPVRFIALGLH